MLPNAAPNPLSHLWEGPPPVPSVDKPSEDQCGGPKKCKWLLTEACIMAKSVHNKKLRATDQGREAKCERRRHWQQDKPPMERLPRCKNAGKSPQGIPMNISTLSHFPTISTGYTGDKYMENILNKEVWTLEKLKAHSLEGFEWDGVWVDLLLHQL